MILYRRLDTIPYKVFVAITEDIDNLHMLSDNESNPDESTHTPIDQLYEVWNKIAQEQQNTNQDPANKKTFSHVKEISALEVKYMYIQVAVDALYFDRDADTIEQLKEYGYRLEEETYIKDLDRISRESKGIITRINQLKNALPKQPEEDVSGASVLSQIDETFAFYANILGYDFDFNKVSYTKVKGMEKQVSAKIKHIEKSNAKNKK